MALLRFFFLHSQISILLDANLLKGFKQLPPLSRANSAACLARHPSRRTGWPENHGAESPFGRAFGSPRRLDGANLMVLAVPENPTWF